MDRDPGRRLIPALLRTAVGALLISCQTATPAATPPPTPSPTVAITRSAAPSVSSAAKSRGVQLDDPLVFDLPTDGGFAVAADDGALASVNRMPDGSTRLIVIDLRTKQQRAIATEPGRFVYLMPGGALRKDLVTYFQQEERGGRAGGAESVTWHVMVANWRTGTAPVEVDAIPGEIEPDPHLNVYFPNPVTNGRDVIWMRAPRENGKLGTVEIRRWTAGASSVAYAGQASYAIDDDGRIAIVRQRDPGGAWELSLVDPSGRAQALATRDRGGMPYLAGPKLVWARAPAGPLAVTAVDVVDIAKGGSQSVTGECPFIGATVRHVVFGCRDRGSRIVSVDDLSAGELDDFFYRADPHAILGRSRERWTVTPVAD